MKRVRCIDNMAAEHDLTVGGIYELTNFWTDDHGARFCTIKGSPIRWMRTRFEDVIDEDSSATFITDSGVTFTSTDDALAHTPPETPPFDFDAYNGLKRR